MMAGFLLAVGVVLSAAQLVLLARVVVDWATVLSPSTGPPTALAKVATVLHRVSEPFLSPLRRIFPPVRLGGVGLDLSVTVAFLILVLVRALLGV